MFSRGWSLMSLSLVFGPLSSGFLSLCDHFAKYYSSVKRIETPVLLWLYIWMKWSCGLSFQCSCNMKETKTNIGLDLFGRFVTLKDPDQDHEQKSRQGTFIVHHPPSWSVIPPSVCCHTSKMTPICLRTTSCPDSHHQSGGTQFCCRSWVSDVMFVCILTWVCFLPDVPSPGCAAWLWRSWWFWGSWTERSAPSSSLLRSRWDTAASRRTEIFYQLFKNLLSKAFVGLDIYDSVFLVIFCLWLSVLVNIVWKYQFLNSILCTRLFGCI